MGFFSDRERLLAPSRTRFLFLLIAAAAFAATELGRFVYRPWAYERGIADLGLADSIGNLGGIVVQIFVGVAVINPTPVQSYRLAAFFAAGYVLYEFAQPYLPRGVFDWGDVGATVLGWVITVVLLKAVWRGEGAERRDQAT